MITSPQSIPDWRSRVFSDAFFYHHARQYLVTLHVEILQLQEAKNIAYTGFLVSIRGGMLWMTAGHVVDEIQAILNDNAVTVLSAGWVDGYGDTRAGRIPCDLPSTPMLSYFSRGVDVGLVKIRPSEARPLEANASLRCLRIDFNHGDRTDEPTGYFVVGAPIESLAIKAVGQDEFLGSINRYALPMVPVAGDASLPGTDPLFWNRESDLYGKLIDYSDDTPRSVKSIRGMSGGPVFAVYVDGQNLGVELVGVQSAWLGDSRIVRVAKMSEFYRLATADLQATGG